MTIGQNELQDKISFVIFSGDTIIAMIIDDTIIVMFTDDTIIIMFTGHTINVMFTDDTVIVIFINDTIIIMHAILECELTHFRACLIESASCMGNMSVR